MNPNTRFHDLSPQFQCYYDIAVLRGPRNPTSQEQSGESVDIVMERGSPSEEAVSSPSEPCDNHTNPFQYDKGPVGLGIFPEVEETANKEPKITITIPSTSTRQIEKHTERTKKKTNHEIRLLN